MSLSSSASSPEPFSEVLEDCSYTLVARRWVTPSIVELELEPLTEDIVYTAGQYVLLGDEGYRIPVRSYSIANAPEPGGRLVVLVTLIPHGAASTWLVNGLQVGERLLVSGPYGTFVIRPEQGGRFLLVAGGSGWAPVRALAQALLHRGGFERLDMLFSARTEHDVVDRELMAQWQGEHDSFSYVRTLTRADGPKPTGRIQKILPALWPDLAHTNVYVAGPPGLVAACAASVRSLGLESGSLYTEEFYSDPVPWG